MPYHSAYLRARASRSRFAPQVIAYWLMSSRMARAAASFSASGAGKFGNPCARLIAPCSLASRVMPRITDSVKPCVRRAVCMAGGGATSGAASRSCSAACCSSPRRSCRSWRRSERPPRYADHLSADADAAGVEGLDRHLVAFAHLSHYAGRGQLAAVEDQFARARRADAELVFLLADREPAAVALDHERGDPFVALREVGVREYHDPPRFGPVGDPQL